jgi:hypothetical protein
VRNILSTGHRKSFEVRDPRCNAVMASEVEASLANPKTWRGSAVIMEEAGQRPTINSYARRKARQPIVAAH